MAELITLDNLRIRCRDRADMSDSEFISDSELDNHINNSLGELYDILISQYGNEAFLDAYQFNTVANQNRYDLPTDFYKLYGVDLHYNNRIYQLNKFIHADRALYQNEGDEIRDGKVRLRYRLRDGHIDIYPAPTSAYECEMWYIRQVPKLVDSSDTVPLTIVNSWLEYVELDVAIKLLQKEESDYEHLLIIKNMLMQRIATAAKNRDATENEPEPDEGLTLFNLKTQCRYRTGMTTTDVVTDRELTHYINQSLFELQDLMIKAYGNEYFLDAYEINVQSDQDTYDLPLNFYKIGGVDVEVGGELYTATAVNWNERNIYDNIAIHTHYDTPLYKYRIVDHSIKIFPTRPQNSFTKIIIWYAPIMPKLVNNGDKVEINFVENWLEYVIVDVGIKMLTKTVSLGKQESQAALQAMMATKASLKQRLEEMIAIRDWANPATITDVSRSEWIYTHDY